MKVVLSRQQAVQTEELSIEEIQQHIATLQEQLQQQRARLQASRVGEQVYQEAQRSYNRKLGAIRLLRRALYVKMDVPYLVAFLEAAEGMLPPHVYQALCDAAKSYRKEEGSELE